MPDVFPATLQTWIGAQLDCGASGRLCVNQHVMSTYEWPLQVYYCGTNSRWLGEPEDIVNGFFASRLGQPDFFNKWQGSGLRLRRWLMNAFSYYLMELRRESRSRHRENPFVDDQVTFSGEPNAAFDRAAALGFVRQAMHEAQQSCQQEHLEAHWRMFMRHHVDGVSFQGIAHEAGVNAARAAVMSRTATRKFRAALRDVLVRDGVAHEGVDDEIQNLLQELAR